MKRDPTLKVKKSDFSIILEESLSKNGIEVSSVDMEFIVGTVYELSKPYNTNRNILISNDKVMKELRKKTELKETSEAERPQLFFKIYKLLIKKKQKRVSSANFKKSEDQFIRASQLAEDFSNEFELPLKEGYQEYIETSLELSDRRKKYFYIGQLSSVTTYDLIRDTYDMKLKIKYDKYKSFTMNLEKYYRNKIISMVGYYDNDNSKIETTFNFVEASAMCNRLKVGFKDFIDSQFNTTGNIFIPAPYQLTTKNAEMRLIKYMASQGRKIKPTNKVENTNVDWDTILGKGGKK